MIRPTPYVRPYAVTTHSIPAGPACRPCWIDGMATFTMKKSRTIMKVPVSITASGAHV